MYTFYTDKQEVFECKLDLEGAKLTDSRARLVLESDAFSLLFYGTIDGNGKCSIPVSKLKNILQESNTGKVKLEVIAEDTFFEPWSDTYTVKTNKKVTVEVVSKETPKQISEKKVTVSAVPQSNQIDRSTQFLKLLEKKNITLANIKENIKTIQKLSELFSNKFKLSEQEKRRIVEGVVKKLK